QRRSERISRIGSTARPLSIDAVAGHGGSSLGTLFVVPRIPRRSPAGTALREPVVRHAFWELLLDEHDRTATRKDAIDPFDEVIGGSDLELRRERPRSAASEVQEFSVRLETIGTEQLSDRRPTLTKALL